MPTAVFLLALAPAMAFAQPGLDQTGRWAVSGPWGHQAIHLAVLRGDGTHHSKIVSVAFAWPPVLYGWNPAVGPGGAACASFPDEQFEMLLQDSTLAGIDPSSIGHSSLANGDLLVTGGHGPGYAGDGKAYIFRRNAVAPLPQWIAQDSMSLERYYHASTTLGNGDVLVHGGSQYYQMAVYGGTADPTHSSSAVREEIQRMALTGATCWLTTQTPVLRPEPREGHSAITLGARGLFDTTVVFGGRRASGQVLNDTWGMHVDASIDTMDWDPINASNPPAARTRHSAVLLNDRRMVVYGGLGTGATVHSDVRDLRPPNGVLSWRWSPTDLNPGGPNNPGARYGHTAVYDGTDGRNRMLVFGGRNSGGLADNDLYALDMTTMTWSKPTLQTADKPAAREGHSWTFDPQARTGPFSASDRRAVLFGGQTGSGLSNEVWVLWIGPSGTLRWEQRMPSTPPTGRLRHGACWDESSPNGLLDRLLVHGGDVGGTASAGTWALDFNLSAWTILTNAGLAQAGHTATFRTNPLVALYAERYSAATGQWTTETSPRALPSHPNMFLLPSGNLFFAGPRGITHLYKTSGPPPHWIPLGESSVFGMPAVLLYRPNPDQAVEIMKCGGYLTATNETAKINIRANDTAPLNWQVQNPAMGSALIPRVEHNLVMLPTGRALVTGGRHHPTHGGEADADTLTNPGIHQPQEWDPDLGPAGAWLGGGVLAPDPARRGFHSTAILLPDARVLSLGSNPPTAFRYLATLFCPPYLFNPGGSLARRPTIAAWHDSAGYGRPLSIWTESPDSIVSVCLIKPGAVTHSHNQDQRYIKLDFQVVARTPQQGCPSSEIVATTPAHSNLAPPGDYLLFIVKRSPFDGTAPADTVVPSVAQWVRLRPGTNGPMAGGPPSTCPPLEIGDALPSQWSLHQNRPNPFAGGTTIRFDLPAESAVRLEVFDLLGRRIRTLASRRFAPGRHEVEWDQRDDRGARVRAGIYAYRLSAGPYREERKMVLLP